MILFNQLPIPPERALNRSCLPLWFRLILHGFKHDWPSSGRTNGKLGSCLGHRSSPLQTCTQSVHPYASLFNLLLDPVEAVRAESSLHPGCTLSWSNPPTAENAISGLVHQIYLWSKERARPSVRESPFSIKNTFWVQHAGLCWHLSLYLSSALVDVVNVFICLHTCQPHDLLGLT